MIDTYVCCHIHSIHMCHFATLLQFEWCLEPAELLRSLVYHLNTVYAVSDNILNLTFYQWLWCTFHVSAVHAADEMCQIYPILVHVPGMMLLGLCIFGAFLSSIILALGSSLLGSTLSFISTRCSKKDWKQEVKKYLLSINFIEDEPHEIKSGE